MSSALFTDDAFTPAEQVNAKFKDWIDEFHRLVTLWLGHRLDPSIVGLRHEDHPEVEAERSIEQHLNRAPLELAPRRICFRMGGGGMGSIYSPPAIAPSAGDDPGELEDRLPTQVSVSGGVGQAIYIDPLVYRDWGWINRDQRPVPKPEPVPSVGGEL